MVAKPVTRNSAWWEAGSSPCSLSRENGLSASLEGWLGKGLSAASILQPHSSACHPGQGPQAQGSAMNRLLPAPGKAIESLIYLQRAEDLVNIIMKLLSFI